jgi:hypothetical protein
VSTIAEAQPRVVRALKRDCDVCGKRSVHVRPLEEIGSRLRPSMAGWITQLCPHCARRFRVDESAGTLARDVTALRKAA